MRPIVEPFYRNGEVRFSVGISGAHKRLVYSRAELAALRSLIDESLEADHVHRTG